MEEEKYIIEREEIDFGLSIIEILISNLIESDNDE